MNDEQLRERFEQWAAPLRMTPPPLVTQLHRRSRRRTTRLATAASSALATAALACAAVIAIVLVTAQPHPGSTLTPNTTPAPASVSSFWGHGRYPAPPHSPYLIRIMHSGNDAQLIDMSNRSVLATLQPTQLGYSYAWAAAATSGRVFVLAEQSATYATIFTELAVSAPDKPIIGVTPMRPRLTGQIYAMAVSPDGAEVAVSTEPPDGIGTASRISVYDLSTGALTGTWTARDGTALSLTFVPGDRLGLGWQGSNGGQTVRILNLATASGTAAQSLLADSRQVVGTPAGFYSAALTAQATRVLALAVPGGKAPVLEEIAAASGKVLATIPIGTANDLQQSPSYCGILWADPTGTRLITQCGNRQLLVTNGVATPARLALSVPAAPVGWLGTFAW